MNPEPVCLTPLHCVTLVYSQMPLKAGWPRAETEQEQKFSAVGDCLQLLRRSWQSWDSSDCCGGSSGWMWGEAPPTEPDADIQPVELTLTSAAREAAEFLSAQEKLKQMLVSSSHGLPCVWDTGGGQNRLWASSCSSFDGGYSSNILLQAACFHSAWALGIRNAC